jgi:hypothetical protein
MCADHITLVLMMEAVARGYDVWHSPDRVLPNMCRRHIARPEGLA